MEHYSELPAFANVVLEASYVLEVSASQGQFRIVLDLVLTPDHPEYTAPPPTEQECYRKAELTFAGVQSLHWSEQGQPPAVDASGEADWGSIDGMRTDGQEFAFDGDFGHVVLRAAEVSIALVAKTG